MPSSKKPPRRAQEIGEALRESVDFKGKHQDKEGRAAKLRAARQWLRLPLREFLAEMQIGPNDPEYDEIVAIWRDFHD